MTDKPIADMTVEELLAYEACSYGKVTRVCQQDAAVNELARRATAGEAAEKERDWERSTWPRLLSQALGRTEDETGRTPSMLASGVSRLRAERDELRSELDDVAHAIGRWKPLTDSLEVAVHELVNELHRLAKVAGNAEQGDCLRGELGTVECPVNAPCGVCELTRERDAALERERRLREAVVSAKDHKFYVQQFPNGVWCVSLNDVLAMLNKILESAHPETQQPVPARPMPVETFAEAPKPPECPCPSVCVAFASCGSDGYHAECTKCGWKINGGIAAIASKSVPYAEAPKPPPADEPALAEISMAHNAGEIVCQELLTRAILELARRPR